MIIVGIVLCVIALIIIALLKTENDGEQVIKTFMMSIILMVIINFVYDIGYNSGVKDGAFNQLRGKYEVTYVIDKDSCVVDTIINLN